MKTILCTYGGIAYVDDEDYERINSFHWNDYGGYGRTFKRIEGVLKSYSMHRLVLELTDTNIKVDHINGNVLDNRKVNLRFADTQQNGCNRKVNKNSSTGVKGVIWHRRDKRYQANIKVKGKRIHLGYFITLEEAKEAYNKASKIYHGEFGRKNE